MISFDLKTPRKKIILVLIITLSVTLISVLIRKSGLTESLNRQIFDYKMNLFCDNLKPDSNIVLIVIDQNSLDYFEKNAISWPWPRSFYGIVLDYLKEKEAGPVLFDIDFSSNEVERLETETKSSQSDFSSSILNYKNAILISSLEQSGNVENSLKDEYFFEGPFKKFYNNNYGRTVSPIEEFQNSTKYVGVANMEKDKDGIIRTVPFIYRFKSKYLPNVSLLQFLIQKNQNAQNVRKLVSNLPLDDSSKFLINWYGPGLNESKFKYYPFYALFNLALNKEKFVKPSININLKGKSIIIGGAAFGLLDYKPVPIWNGPPYPGMEIHATVLSNLTQNHFIRLLPDYLLYFFVFVVSMSAAISVIMFTKKRYSISILLGIAIVFVLFDNLIFAYWRININSAEPMLSYVVSVISASFFAFIWEGKEKRKIKRIFSRYLNDQVIDELLNESSELEFKGKDADVTVFFSDIENFTTISEKLNPRELVDLLNSYFSFISEIILSYNAMLDKYIGDSVMAIFGAPLTLKDHALMACKAALEIKNKSEDFNSDKINKLKTRIGINTGRVVLGNVGSNKRLDYTAIGDTVNVASRLESINKYFGTQILISETTYELVKDKMIAREIDMVQVKGKQQPVRIFELLSSKNDDEKSILYKKEFEEALNLYRSDKFKEAEDLFRKLNIEYSDLAAKIYIERINQIKADPTIKNQGSIHIFFNK